MFRSTNNKALLVAPGIVLRLRIVFLALSCALVAVTITTFVQMRFLSRSVGELTQSSVTTFLDAEEAERSLKSLLLVLQRVENVQTLEELYPVIEQTDEYLGILQSHLSDISAFNFTTGSDESMDARYAEIDISARQILGTRGAIVARKNRIEVMTEDLLAKQHQVLVIFETLSYEAAGIDVNRSYIPSAPEAKMGDGVDQYYRQYLAISTALSSISLEIDSVIKQSIWLQGVAEKTDLDMATAELAHRIRNIAILTGQLPEGASRTSLAKVVLDLRTILFGQSGYINELSQLLELKNIFLAVKSDQLVPIERISSVSAQLQANARQEIDTANRRLNRATENVITLLALVMLMLLVGIAVVMTVIVEKQINHRMARLTKAVTAIADGKTDYDVDVSGPDELGKMADALQVFKETAEELRRSNSELEKFAYVAAHDLRSPLRAIQDLSSWLLEDKENVFSAEGKEIMDLMAGRISRINQLLTDLLEYSRAGNIGVEFAEVNMRGIVGDVREMLDPDQKHSIKFVGDHDSFVSYQTPMRQILINLVNNAIKHHDRDTAAIVIETQIVNDRVRCTVRDDGPGIEPRYHSKIFGLFQTLKTRDEVEASGLGLAIIHKLLDRHRGAIKIVSDPSIQRGTDFIFDLPIDVPKAAPLKKAA